MVSIIICSVSPHLLKDLQQNIAQTIGVEYEIIAIDNREKHWPIAKVYNYGAQQSIHICFLCMKILGYCLISGESL